MKQAPLRFILFIILIVSLFFGVWLSKDYSLNHFKGTSHHEKNWTLQIDELGSSETVNLPITFNYEEKYKYSLSKKLTYTPTTSDSPYAFLSINHMYFKIYLDNKEIFSYSKNETPHYSKSPGNSYVTVPLPKDCTGKEFRIDFWPTLESGILYKFEDITFGDYPTVLHKTFKKDFIHNLMVICILFTGITLVLFSGVILDKENNSNAWHIGIFAILFGLYGLTESLFNLYVISNPYITYLINFFIFAAMPIPILLFFKEKVLPQFHKIYNITLLLLSFNIIVQIFLHFSKIQDIRQLLKYSHMLLALTFLVIFISVYKTPKSSYCEKKHLILSIIPIIIGLILDGIFHYFFIYAVHRSNTFYLHLGVLFFLVMQAIQVFHNVLITYRENIKIEFYKTLAYEDGLTGSYNRSCYNNQIKQLKDKPELLKNLICVCVDINDLKQINDKNGHQVGDQSIRQTAEFLKKHFDECGKVFRIGGDEFYIFIYGLGEQEFCKKLKNLYKDLNKYNETHSIKLHFALGYEVFKENDTIENCISRADKNMYSQKLKFKFR